MTYEATKHEQGQTPDAVERTQVLEGANAAAITPLAADPKPAWGAVFALALGVVGLIASETLPVSLLTPIAKDLGVTQGAAGQAVTATALVALVSSLLIPILTRRFNRRHVLLSFTTLLVGSNLLVAFAPNFPVLLLGRVLLGIGLGGFWAMSAAVTMRLVPESLIPRALSIIFGGISIASVVAAPLGSYFGAAIGWRGVFMAAAAVGLLALVWQAVVLPSMAPSGQARLSTLFDLLKRPQAGVGMAGVVLGFAGHFAFFTYMRPFLETVSHVSVSGLSGILLAFGVASFLGTSLAGPMLERNLRATLATMPLVMSLLAAGLVVAGNSQAFAAVFVALWGFFFAVLPVGWSTWLTRTVPDEAESGGGLLSAAIQLAITAGAAIGGVVFDHEGAKGAFIVSSVILLFAALVTAFGLKSQRGNGGLRGLGHV